MHTFPFTSKNTNYVVFPLLYEKQDNNVNQVPLLTSFSNGQESPRNQISTSNYIKTVNLLSIIRGQALYFLYKVRFILHEEKITVPLIQQGPFMELTQKCKDKHMYHNELLLKNQGAPLTLSNCRCTLSDRYAIALMLRYSIELGPQD